ncbi:hypothetical protein CMQ_6924 [Grosmannia clavigera kw1407]|uniref:Amidoligase enzyme n=1 Tax=Grosmannia clavigera (strain kw1407 / UAMH 11150) TaxID=655863 RepID=F0X7M8_GROCL|nr:uncharacterized protein CMQ_6924 [Grosmannia clavigera kw1407]EFX06603.1 hypothetical protein CMQ_6924 [Grosmannia clavigera kw1407]
MPSIVDTVTESIGAGRPLATGPDTVENLALGLELKFLLLGQPLNEGATPRDRLSEAPIMNRAQLYRQAYTSIARVVGRTNFGFGGNGIGGSSIHPRALSRDDILDAGHQESEYWPTHWIVKKANSVEHTKDDPSPDMGRTNGIAVPVELNSPILSWTDPYSPFLVREVVSRITTFPVAVNYTCDFHVHVGRQDGRAFSLSTLKKLATIFWLAEPILRSVRNPHSPNFSNSYTWGFEQRRYSRLALALDCPKAAGDGFNIAEAILQRVRSRNGLRRHKDDREDDWYLHMGEAGPSAAQNEALRAIWQAVSHRELGLLLSGPQRKYRRLGFNFSAFGEEDERARTNPRTVEFRVLEGTMQSELILGWLQICGKLVELGTKGHQTHFCAVVHYLLSKQHVYEDLRMLDYRTSSFGSWNFDVLPTGRMANSTSRSPRDVLFRELMDLIGVESAASVPFQMKIRQEYGCR